MKDDDDNESLKCKREDSSELQDCERCEGIANIRKCDCALHVNLDLDQRIGYHYKGFPVHNQDNTNRYKKVTNAECQKLCRETPGCFYYNYDKEVQGCWLKYGIALDGIESDEAKKNSSDKLKFGHKYSNLLVDCEYYWSDWSNCSADCGGGNRTREMNVTKNPEDVAEKYRGIPCPAPYERFQNKSCNDHHCPVNCVSKWGQWSKCSATCGDGTKTRVLEVETEMRYGGSSCPEPRTQNKTCKEAACPVNCAHEWTKWSACSLTCGNGTKTRSVKNITANPEGLGEIQVLVDNNSTNANATIRLRLYDMSAGNNTESLWNCSTGWMLSLQGTSVKLIIT